MFRTDYEAAYHWRVVGDNFLEARRNREEAARYREEAARLKEISRQCRAFTAFVDEHGPKYREEIAGWIGKINELWDKYYDQSVNRAGYEAGYNAALAILKEERDNLDIPWETARTRINGAIDAAIPENYAEPNPEKNAALNNDEIIELIRELAYKCLKADDLDGWQNARMREIQIWIDRYNALREKYYDQSVNRAGYEAGYNAAGEILKEQRDNLSIPWETVMTRVNGAIDAAVKARENG